MSAEEQPPLNIPVEDWAITPESVRNVVRQVEKLVARIEELEARLKQNSKNSSRPPSSDSPYKNKPKGKPKGGFRGGQAGHEGNHRALVDVNEVTEVITVRPEECRACHNPLSTQLPEARPAIRQQVYELPVVKPVITEYQLQALICPKCQKVTRAEPLAEMPPGGYGPGVGAMVGQLHGRFQLSIAQTSEAMEDLFGIPLSTGSVSAICRQISAALAKPYEELREALPKQHVLNIDETPWKQNGKLKYLWGVVGAALVVYEIAAKRDKQVLGRLLSDQFAGIVGSDRHGSYNLVPAQRRQVCWAHITRNLVAAYERGGPGKQWAKVAVDLVEQMWAMWESSKEQGQSRVEFAEAFDPLREKIMEHLEASEKLPKGPTRALGQNLVKLKDALWTFTQDCAVEPTNNSAEQALRRGVIWRRSSFGTQSEDGSIFVERILSVVATCQKQDKHLLTFLTEALRAHWFGLSHPSLLPTS